MVRIARLRTLIATGLCAYTGALLLPFGFRALLPLRDTIFWPLLWGHLIGASLITLVVAIASWVALWPATPYLDLRPGDPEPRGAEPREAKAAALSFPGRVATAGTCVGELAVAAGGLALTVSGQPPLLTLSLALITASMVALSWVLLYTLGQQAVAPLLHRLRDVVLLPQSRPAPALSIGSHVRGRLAFSLLSVVGAGLCWAGIFAAAYLPRVADVDTQAQRERIARYVTLAAQGLEPHRARLLAEAIPLSQGALQPWSPQLSRKEAVALDKGSLRPVRVPLPSSSASSGVRALYLPPAPPFEDEDVPVGMFVALAALFSLGAVLALGLGAVVHRDVDSLISQVRGLYQGPVPPQAGQVVLRAQGITPPRTAEAQQVFEALGRLLDRMRRLHVDSYLAIERTIDARRAKSQFLASMSHDLRSPLSSVLGFSELLTSGYEGDIPDEARRLLLHIHKTGRRLLRLLSEILDTAKVESQTIELHPRRCSPAEMLSQAVAEVRRGRMHEDIPIILDLPPPGALRPIVVDPLRFPQALAHLIGHVLDGTAADSSSTPGGLSPGQVRITAREERGAPDRGQVFVVSVEHVRPSGSGTEPKAASPLGTVGLGLALPLARRLIALHGGTIEVAAPSDGDGDPDSNGDSARRPALRAILPLR